MTNGFERRREQSKEEIRRAAWELFAQFGVARVSMADIARKAGVSQATIYNNFESKEALAREFETDVVDRLVGRIEQVLAQEKPFREKMAAFLSFIAEMLAAGRPFEAGTNVFTSSTDLQNDPEIRRMRDATREKMTALLLRLAAEGRAQGEVNVSVSEEALRIYFGAFMDMFIDPQLQRRSTSSPDLVQELGSLMISGLTGPGAAAGA